MEIKKLPLASVTTVCTEKQYLRFVADNSDKKDLSYIQVVNDLKRGEQCAFEIKGELPPKSIAVFPTDDVEIGYLLFLLNSYPTQYEMFERKMNVLTHVVLNKKKLSSLEIPIVAKSEQWYYNIARLLKNKAEEQVKNPNKDYHMAELSYGLFSNLCDSLAIELYYDDYLNENGVEIFKCWKQNVDNNLDINNLKEFFRGLLDQSSELRNQLMKLRMLPTE